MKILVTGGGTREPIDGVRFITNFSTGKTAARLADVFAFRGHQVIAVMGEGSVRPNDRGCEVIEYGSFADLNRVLQELLSSQRFDAVVHLAAVGDYSVASIESGDRKFEPGAAGKIDSGKELVLRLSPNFKIVERLRSYARDASFTLIAFKLTNTADPAERAAAVRKLSQSGPGSGIDWIVHNDLSDRRTGHAVFTLYRGIEAVEQVREIDQLADALLTRIENEERRK